MNESVDKIIRKITGELRIIIEKESGRDKEYSELLLDYIAKMNENIQKKNFDNSQIEEYISKIKGNYLHSEKWPYLGEYAQELIDVLSASLINVKINLEELMEKHNIKSVSSLERQLKMKNLYISRQTLQRLSQNIGVEKMNLSTIIKLKKFFNCSLDDLFTITWGHFMVSFFQKIRKYIWQKSKYVIYYY